MSYYTARCTYCDLEVGSRAPRQVVAALAVLAPAQLARVRDPDPAADRDRDRAAGADGHAHEFVIVDERAAPENERVSLRELLATADVDERIANAFAQDVTR